MELTTTSPEMDPLEYCNLSTTDLVENLIELFREIDINGDGGLEWSEFTGYIVEKAFVFDQFVDEVIGVAAAPATTVDHVGRCDQQALVQALDESDPFSRGLDPLPNEALCKEDVLFLFRP